MIDGAQKDKQSMTPDWEPVRELIDGVRIKEVKNILTNNGVTTEVFREDWNATGKEVKHIIHVSFHPRAVSAWHRHEFQTDAILVTRGFIKMVLYDDRETSPTRGLVNVLNLGASRPGLVVVPPYVWHGLQNMSDEISSFINFFDRQYRYDDPDEWRLPADTPEIPYTF